MHFTCKRNLSLNLYWNRWMCFRHVHIWLLNYQIMPYYTTFKYSELSIFEIEFGVWLVMKCLERVKWCRVDFVNEKLIKFGLFFLSQVLKSRNQTFNTLTRWAEIIIQVIVMQQDLKKLSTHLKIWYLEVSHYNSLEVFIFKKWLLYIFRNFIIITR